MIPRRRLLCALLALLAATPGVRAAARGPLVWADEFNQPDNSAPDPARWTYDLGGGGWGNNELETYTDSRDNSRIVSDATASDGKALLLQAVKLPGGYSSARLKTLGKFSTRFGRVEARIRCANGQGLWGAFWMLGENIAANPWPACGEIDLMEVLNANPNRVYGTLHGPGYSGGQGIGNNTTLPGGATLDAAYHVFAIDWSPGKILWSVDGTVYHTVTSSTIPAGRSWVFDDHNFFILLNLAVGGYWPGNPDATTPFPGSLYVDYVRVYAQPAAAPIALAGYASGASEVTLTWQPPASPDGAVPTGYRLQRATDSAFAQNLATFDASAATSYLDTTAAPATTYYYRVSALTGVAVGQTSTAVSIRTPASTPAGTARLVNLSGRAFGGIGNNVAIGGFVIRGTAAKRILLRAVGPSLATQGLATTEVMPDPTIELHDALHGNATVATNDNWADNANAADIVSTSAAIGANALAPADTASSALLLPLPPGIYSVVARDRAGASGIVLVEIYDADPANPAASLINISTRADCESGNRVTIGGFVIAGSAPKRVLLRAVGPTLSTQGLRSTELLADPTIEVHDTLRANATIALNDDWSANANAATIVTTGARIGATPFSLADDLSSALLLTLPAGVYSFVVRGAASAGIVLAEIYDAD